MWHFSHHSWDFVRFRGNNNCILESCVEKKSFLGFLGKLIGLSCHSGTEQYGCRFTDP